MSVRMAAIETMERLGGSFVRALAECWLRADPANRARLEAAFADYFNQYADLAAKRGAA
jgi:hypothetical protein